MLSMTGKKEQKVTCPEFYRLPSGNVLFFYREGSSGWGNVMLNLYNTDEKKWLQIQDSFIDGKGDRRCCAGIVKQI
jgi:putative BNR repeat neuraminidase